MTNTSIAYFLIFFMVIKLSIYAIHGTSTQYNNLFSTVNNGVSQVYSPTVRGVSNTKQDMQKHIKERKQFKINRNKQQLSSLAKQAKTREQGYRRVNK
uniref:Plectrovirus spv1-r8a2b orf 5 n-terminal truncated transmembrane protein n=1 Tax=Spiroplasma citri TaxID=2133 RepID=Q14L85_SPICI|nr:plectrovirus spv1-r8a2b orf 5 n-terminal truncated transmembrane protein [Spiroplasma citri]